MKRSKLLILLIVVVLGAILAFMLVRPAAQHVLISNVVAKPVMGQPGALAVTLAIENKGGPDTLVSAASPDANATAIEGLTSDDGAPIPAGAAPALATDGAHIVLTGIEGAIGDGRLVPVTLTFRGAGTLAAKARVSVATDTMDHSAHIGHGYSVGDGEPAPALSLSVEPLAGDAGWRVTLATDNFTFSRDNADGPHVPGMGHGHLYVGGLKIGRLYEQTAEIGALPPGAHTVRVTLNTNDHRAYVVDGTPVTAETTIRQ